MLSLKFQLRQVLGLLLLCGILSAVNAQTMSEVMQGNNFYEIQEKAENYFLQKRNNREEKEGEKNEKDSEFHRYKRWEWYWENRVMPDGSFPDPRIQHEALKKLRTKSGNKNSQIPWKSISFDTHQGGYWGMGCATAVAFHPTNPDIFYVGAPIGGVWRTKDRGRTYEALGDDLPYVSVGSVLVDHQNPKILYISLGDSRGWWNFGLGIYKSTDEGKTWKPSLSRDFTNETAIYEMAMSPANSKIILAATSRGLYRTDNGGASWNAVFTGAVNEVKFRPNDSNVVYAAKDDYWGSSEILKSTNGGKNWTTITNFAQDKSAINFTVSPANPDLLVVRHAKAGVYKLYVSTNGGTTLNLKPTVPEGGVIFASPTSANTLYTGWLNVYRSRNGGNTWQKLTHWHEKDGYVEVHADQEKVAYHPITKEIYFCNHGGVYVHKENTTTWRDVSAGLVITQYYRLATAQDDPGVIIGGTQDNGGNRRNADGSWQNTNGGDAMEVAIDPRNNNVIYTTYVNGRLYRSRDGWKRDVYHDISNNIPGGKPNGAWVTPYVLDPNNPDVLVAGYDEVYRSPNQGDSWTKISRGMTNGKLLGALSVAPSDSRVIYTAEDNNFYATFNLGNTWRTPVRVTNNNNDDITSILIDPNNRNRVWVTISGYRAGQKVFQSTNGGQSWTNISQGIPNVPANGSVYDPKTNTLYIGTDAGVFSRRAWSSAGWKLFGKGLPNTSVTDLEIQYSTRKLRISTYGRGFWEADLPGTARVTFRKPDQTPKEIRKSLVNYSYYKGKWERLSDLSQAKPSKIGFVQGLKFKPAWADKHNFTVSYEAYIEIPKSGVYTFYTDSKAASGLYIGDELIVDNDGTEEKSGSIRLKKGKHAISVAFFVPKNDGKALAVSYKGEDIAKQIIPKEVLWSKTPAPKRIRNNGEIIGVIYPNPFAESFQVDISPEAEATRLEVLDDAGKVVYQQTLGKAATTTTVDLPKVSSGIFYIKIYGEDGAVYQKRLLKID